MPRQCVTLSVIFVQWLTRRKLLLPIRRFRSFLTRWPRPGSSTRIKLQTSSQSFAPILLNSLKFPFLGRNQIRLENYFNLFLFPIYRHFFSNSSKYKLQRIAGVCISQSDGVCRSAFRFRIIQVLCLYWRVTHQYLHRLHYALWIRVGCQHPRP